MYILIVNKTAGNGQAAKLQQSLEQDPLYKQSNCRTFFTEYPGHAEKIARQVAEMKKKQLKAIIVIGGDGTFHEVVNGLIPYPDIPLGLLPTGAGNDFARGINLKGRNDRLFHNILAGARPVSFWTGLYSTDYRSDRYARRFLNSAGFGFDAKVVSRSNQGTSRKKLRKMGLSSFIYIIALLKTLRDFHPYQITLKLDGEGKELENVWMVVVSNHPYFGGGMKINPGADMASSKLSVLVLQNIPKWKVLALFASVYIGKHFLIKEVTVYEVGAVELQSREAIPFQVDGQAGVCKQCRMMKDKQKKKIFTSLN